MSSQSLALMPVLDIQQAVARRSAIVEYVRALMEDGTDFGAIPGTEKKTLLKPGAEKLCTLFGLSPRFEIVHSVTDWTGAAHGEPFFEFTYRCTMYHGDQLIAQGDGSCNSMESKYRYRWVNETDIPAGVDKATLKARLAKLTEFAFAIEKSETVGKYGKPAEYWQQFHTAIVNDLARRTTKPTKSGQQMEAWEIDASVYRLPNPDIADLVNTIGKMAQKRALIAATLIAVNASEFFTQDLEDFADQPPSVAATDRGEVIESAATVKTNGSAAQSGQNPTMSADGIRKMQADAAVARREPQAARELARERHRAADEAAKARGIDTSKHAAKPDDNNSTINAKAEYIEGQVKKFDAEVDSQVKKAEQGRMATVLDSAPQ